MKTLVAVSQMTSTDKKHENVNCAEGLIEKASKVGAKLVSLPENWAFLGAEDNASFYAAESLDGPTITRMKQCAKKHAIWLSLGGFHEKIPHHEKIHNTHLIITDQGEIAALYRKIHCFSVELPDGSVYDEAKSVLPGKEVVTLRTPFFTAGLSICYDVRFPYLFSLLRSKGAEVLLVPAAFTDVTGKAHWEVLLRARAIETQCYVIAAAQNGRHNNKRSTHGHAMIIDPWGTLLAQCGETSDVVFAEMDITYLKKLRLGMPLWSHRRQMDNEIR